ncbi:hypothetical protein JOE58_003405 [Curtobacterium luteum]|jgi:hypothetical protein|uniref:DUF1508 domain-containing protein n=1 Tax=Curtobacterium luteum TaxID=33881 RepID=A0ABS2S220_9MICO|nr:MULTISPECIES: hypothetical protein [Curtobacterium]MBM7804154.1 hypothetical protein [Curtobacterium luteum]NUU51039.1 hypothetical protein [Curtobacterium luteum]
MPNRLEWVRDAEDHWKVSFGADQLCEVTRARQYVVSSPDRSIRGAHSSLEGARAQVQAWVRWSGR